MTEPLERDRRGWRAPTLLQVVLAGTLTGAVFGLVFGALSLNRPIANAVVFYLLCAVAGAVLAPLGALSWRLVRGTLPVRNGRGQQTDRR